jgi:X-Pro dipeptidyl-peptidase
MTTSRGRVLSAAAVAAVAALLTLAAPAFAEAAEPTSIVVQDGVTQPVFGYADAIRERVWVQSGFDSDLDGLNDRIALDIMRPQVSEHGLKVPVIMDASPYYSTLGRGNEAELKEDVDGDGLLDRWPLFYDNYFVPRGYAVVLLDMVGTNNSTGCPVTGGLPDHLSAVAGIDWLNGRAKGYNADGNEVVADWHNGKTGMIGKSYDGTLANGAASTGVEGLTTIVPISAISSWYDYTRSNGIRFNTNYPAFLSETVTNPDRRLYCKPVRDLMSANDGDETGDYTPFWAERDYLKDAKNVKASVFVVHGLQDDNVKPNHFSKWWDALPSHVAKKLWLTRTGHVDPFDFRRAAWVSKVHEWFDHELWGVQNDVLTEPQADIEYGADQWRTFKKWPIDGRDDVTLHLGADTPATAGTIRLGPATPPNRDDVFQPFADTPSMSETTAISNPTTVTANRRVFLSPVLQAAVHIAGTPEMKIRAAADDTDTNFSAILVDYGDATQVSRTGEGVLTLTDEDCWGESSASDNPCYRQVEKRLTTVTQWRVTKGILDALNRDSLSAAELLTAGVEYAFDFLLLPQDYIFPEGHRIGLIVLGSFSGYSSIADQNRATITLNVTDTTLHLPVDGGKHALEVAGLDTVTPTH